MTAVEPIEAHEASEDPSGRALWCSCGSWSMLYRNSMGLDARAEHRVHAYRQLDEHDHTTPWAPCACGHPWLRHDVTEYRGDGSEMCCVEGCAQNGCPGKTVSLIDDALAEPCDCDAHNEIRRQMQDPEFAAAWLRTRLRQEAAARTLDDCPCGHSWGRHIFGQLPDSELCCVADCDKTRCPGAAVSLISTPGKPAVEGYSNLHDAPPTLNPDAIRDAYGLGPDPSVALIAFNDALAEDPDFAAAWERALERDPVARTLDVAERTVEKAREAQR